MPLAHNGLVPATIARVLESLGKGTWLPSCPAHFAVGPVKPIDLQWVAKNPGLSLYCVDFETRETLFVETPTEIAVADAPFMYEAQREHATRIVRVPWEGAHQIAADAGIDPTRISLIYSVGRCGSTFVSRALAAFPGMSSLSEPDVMTQLTGRWGNIGLDDPANGQLLRDCTLLQCLPTKLAGAAHWAVKFQSYVTALGPLYAKCLPEAKVVFLYRSLVPWMNSYLRMVGGGDLHETYPNVDYVRFLGSFAPQLTDRIDATRLEVVLFNWLRLMEVAEGMRSSGLPMFLARYEEMAEAPLETVLALGDFCELEEPDQEKLTAAINEDSQAGTMLSRANLRKIEVSFTDEDLATLNDLLEENSDSIRAETILHGSFIAR